MAIEVDKTSENPIATSDNTNDELTRLREENHQFKLDKATSVARNSFNKVWRELGLTPDDATRKLFFRTLVTIDPEDYEVTVLNFDGSPSFDDIGTLVTRIAGTFPGIKPGTGNPESESGGGSTPASPAPSGSKRSKDDFTRAEKIDYITKFGLAAWEKLPLSNKPRNPGGGATREAKLARNWSNEKKAAYMKEHGSLALSQLLAKEREENR